MIDHKSFGLVLGGGGARGMAHVGVLKALNHFGYFPSVIVGVSMGAVIGATYSLNSNWYSDLVSMDVSGFPKVPRFNSPKPGATIKNIMVAANELHDVYFGWGAGEDTADWGRSVVKEITLGKDLEEGRIDVYVCATDLLTGERVVKKSGNAVDLVYASSALAGILPPFDDGAHLLVDGGYSDISPVDVVKDTGVEYVRSVDPGQRVVKGAPQNGLGVFLRSLEVTHNALSKLRNHEADFVLAPPFTRSIGVLEFQYKRECIAAGAKAVRHAKQDLQRLLESA